jgi:hypothetical protein
VWRGRPNPRRIAIRLPPLISKLMGYDGLDLGSYNNTNELFSDRVSLVSIGAGLLPMAPATEKGVTTIRNVRSGAAILRQEGRLTILEIKSRAGSSQRIALSHPSDYRQGTNAPYEAHLLAESPNHFLAFTDTFASNPGNIHGQCGADETGRTIRACSCSWSYPARDSIRPF